ncbi:FAD-binding oxidoreductase [Amycolatopsis taiwanensis]|uniref:FAD-binding oxidoreductase n=1 Tax=Amycolatopsis taiwanensis TaxID=342230 RepID=UPI0004877176|nr:FAD-binding oxidoreductase [Amycolatopsis taiwanensis]
MITRRMLLRGGMGAVGLVAAGSAPWYGSAAFAKTADTRWQRLRRYLSGDVVLPGDPAYPEALQLDSAAFDDVLPQAIAYCENVQDVRTCLRFAHDHDIAVAVRSGGHSAAGYSTTTGLVLDVSRLNAIDVGSSTVELGPGAQGVDILATLSRRGLSVITGNCPTVCMGGYLQGGGVGPLSRKYGVASDRLLSAEVVLADGRVARCSPRREPDLFWALRGGGGGNFGVVTRYEIAPVTTTRMVSFSLSWPWARAAEVIAAYLAWLVSAPDDLTANLTVMNQNAAPGTQPALFVSGSWFGAPAGLNPHLDELVSAVGSAPVSRLADDLSYVDAMMRMFGCGTQTVQQCHRVGYNPEATLPRQSFVLARGRLLEQTMTAQAIGEALAAFEAMPAAGQFRVMSWGGLGGQINRTGPAETAYVHRTAQQYFTYTAGVRTQAPPAEVKASIEAWTGGGFAVARRYGNNEGQINFIDGQLQDWRHAYYGDNYGRLVRTKRRYDPHGFFRFPQAIGQ